MMRKAGLPPIDALHPGKAMHPGTAIHPGERLNRPATTSRAQNGSAAGPRRSLHTTSRSLPALAARLLACALLAQAGRAGAQAAYAATGPGSYLSVGVEASGFQQDYGHHYIGGGAFYLDANLYRRIGVEAELRSLAAHTEEDVKESTWLIGPKISARGRAMRPYVKLLAGRGTLHYPFHYAVGHYFVVAPAAGLDYHLRESRLSIRVIDFEYQLWPRFTYGELHPYGISAGLSFDLFQPSWSHRGIRLGHR